MILPPPLVAYLNSEATTDVESLATCFAADAVVHDEGRVIRGLDAIKAWKKAAKAKYQYTVHPLDVVQDQATVTMRARLSGTFPAAQLRSRTVSSWSVTRLRCWRSGDRTDQRAQLERHP